MQEIETTRGVRDKLLTTLEKIQVSRPDTAKRIAVSLKVLVSHFLSEV